MPLRKEEQALPQQIGKHLVLLWVEARPGLGGSEWAAAEGFASEEEEIMRVQQMQATGEEADQKPSLGFSADDTDCGLEQGHGVVILVVIGAKAAEDAGLVADAEDLADHVLSIVMHADALFVLEESEA